MTGRLPGGLNPLLPDPGVKQTLKPLERGAQRLGTCLHRKRPGWEAPDHLRTRGTRDPRPSCPCTIWPDGID
jgi:hypothetical protein